MQYDKPGFLEIFTDGQGPVSNEEVRRREQALGVNINDNYARGNANTKLDKDFGLFHGLVTVGEAQDELRDEQHSQLASELPGDIEAVEAYADCKVLLYRFGINVHDTGEALFFDEWDHPHFASNTPAVLKPRICIALVGSHTLMHEKFITPFYRYAPGTPNMERVGRDVPYRDEAANGDALMLFVRNTPHIITRCQLQQIGDGRAVTMSGGLSKLLPPGMRR